MALAPLTAHAGVPQYSKEMATKHNPPRATEGERTKRGRPAKKHGQTERQRAIDPAKLKVVAEMMAGGVDYYEMQRMLADRWGLTMRTIRGYRARILADMRDELEEAGFMELGLEKVLGVRRLEEVYFLAMKDKDFRTAHAIIKTRMLVAGALGPQRHEHTFTPGGPPLAINVATTPAQAVDNAKLALAKRLGAKLARKAVDAAAGGE
jgi:hypothetical protein